MLKKKENKTQAQAQTKLSQNLYQQPNCSYKKNKLFEESSKLQNLSNKRYNKFSDKNRDLTPKELDTTTNTNLETNPADIVTNLSKLKLTNLEKSLLNKGLTFVPTPSLKEITDDIDNALFEFEKRMSTIYFFSDKKPMKRNLYRKTKWQPPTPNNNKNLTLFFKNIKRDIFAYKKTLEHLSLTKNLNRKETKQLMRLSQNDTIEIKKGG